MACADPGIFVGGGPDQPDKKALTAFFLAYFTEVKWSISKKSNIFQGSRGGPTFSRGGGGPTFSRGGGGNFSQGGGGSNCLFPIETHITCDFPGGGGGSGPPVPPLDSHLCWHMCAWNIGTYSQKTKQPLNVHTIYQKFIRNNAPSRKYESSKFLAGIVQTNELIPVTRFIQ